MDVATSTFYREHAGDLAARYEAAPSTPAHVLTWRDGL